MDLSNVQGITPKAADIFDGLADALADDVTVWVRRDVTPAPTSSAWSYTVPFEIRSARTGDVIWINGTVAAAAADTSTAGTASVDTATPDVYRGRGEVVLSGDAADWLDTETASVTITYTNLQGGTDTTTFTVTFTA